MAVCGREGVVGAITERSILKIASRGKILPGRTVKDLSASKAAQVRPTMGSVEAAKAMTDSRGPLLVVEDGQLAGIVTATDLVKVIWRVGATFDISDVVSQSVLTSKLWSRIGSIVKKMDSKGVGSVVLTERRAPRAIFTERDLLGKVLYAGLTLDEPALRASTSPLITGEFGIGGREAAAAMVSRRIKRLPLLKGGALAGIVTARDLVQAYAYPYGSRGTEAAAQYRANYGELCPICMSRIDDKGLCGCGAGGG